MVPVVLDFISSTVMCIDWVLDITSVLTLEVSLVAIYYVRFSRFDLNIVVSCSCKGLISPIPLCSNCIITLI